MGMRRKMCLPRAGTTRVYTTGLHHGFTPRVYMMRMRRKMCLPRVRTRARTHTARTLAGRLEPSAEAREKETARQIERAREKRERRERDGGRESGRGRASD